MSSLTALTASKPLRHSATTSTPFSRPRYSRRIVRAGSSSSTMTTRRGRRAREREPVTAGAGSARPGLSDGRGSVEAAARLAQVAEERGRRRVAIFRGLGEAQIEDPLEHGAGRRELHSSEARGRLFEDRVERLDAGLATEGGRALRASRRGGRRRRRCRRGHRRRRPRAPARATCRPRCRRSAGVGVAPRPGCRSRCPSVSGEPSSLARPKSMIFAWPESVIITLLGLRSRCTTSWAWASASPSATSIARSRARAGSIGASASRAARGCPRISSIAMKVAPSASSIS